MSLRQRLLDGLRDPMYDPDGLFGSSDVDTMVGRLAGALRDVVEFCATGQAEGVDGGMVDVDTLRPSDVLAVIAEKLGVEPAGRDGGRG